MSVMWVCISGQLTKRIAELHLLIKTGAQEHFSKDLLPREIVSMRPPPCATAISEGDLFCTFAEVLPVTRPPRTSGHSLFSVAAQENRCRMHHGLCSHVS